MDHAALCIGLNETAEMTQDGLIHGTFFDTCHTADHVIIIDCLAWDQEYKRKVIDLCKTFEGKEYDFQFTLNDNKLYCSELVYFCDFEHRLNLNLSETPCGSTITPTDLLNATNIQVIWDSDD